MPAKGQILFNSSLIGNTATPATTWDGGLSALCINALAYGTVALQVQGPSGAWIPISSSIVSDQVFTFPAAPGQYRLNNSASSSIGVNAVLTSIPYM